MTEFTTFDTNRTRTELFWLQNAGTERSLSRKISSILFTQICQNSKEQFLKYAVAFPQAAAKAMLVMSVDYDFRRWIEVSL